MDAANKNLILSLQQMTSTGDPEIDAQWRSQLQTQFADNTKRKKALTAELEALAQTIRQPAQVRRDIVDKIPQISLNVLDLPDEQQRQLFDAFQLEIRYDRHLQQVTIKVTIHAEMIDSIGKSAANLAEQDHNIPQPRRPTEDSEGRTLVRPPLGKPVPMFDVPPAGYILKLCTINSREPSSDSR
ncbi:MAG TPA: DUF349 domain-containing protein [Candidatus Limnocylindrales bacterium]|nr:DUF349 domain-containing protein [Candidatus Limnocylindrales bacterium]